MLSTITLLIAGYAYLYFTGGPRWLRSLTARIRHRIHGGAGASAAARARELRTPAVRIADRLGIPTQRSRQAQRWEAGAAGERRTAARLAPLARDRWTVLHDRALPGSRANLDHLVISPTGRVYLPDTKRWSARWPVTVVRGRLLHGNRDVTDRLDGLRYEARQTGHVLGVPVQPLVVLDGPPVPTLGLTLDGLRIIPADYLCTELRHLDRTSSLPRQRQAALARAAHRHLPPYTQGPRR